MFRLLEIIKKEISITGYARTTIYLVFVFPLLILLLLSAVFGSETIGEVDQPAVAAFVPQETSEFDREDFIQRLETQKDVEIIYLASKEAVINAVKERRYRLGMALKAPVQKNAPIEITFYLDSTNRFPAEIYYSIASLRLQRIASDIGKDKAESKWEDLNALIIDLNGQMKRIGLYLSDLNSTIASIEELRREIDDVRGIGKVQLNKHDIPEMVDEAENKAKESYANVKTLESESADYKETVEEVTETSAAYIAKPVEFDSEPAFEVKKVTLLIPTAIVILIMLTSMLLSGTSMILERKHGCALRMHLAKTSNPLVFAGKILGQLFFPFVEIALLLFLAVAFFGVEIAASPISIFALVLIVSFVFVSYGLSLSLLGRNETTLILVSLVIIVPSILLSGIAIPVDFAAAWIKPIVELLPLTIASELMEGTILNNQGLLSVPWKLAAMLLPALAALGVFLKLEKGKYD